MPDFITDIESLNGHTNPPSAVAPDPYWDQFRRKLMELSNIPTSDSLGGILKKSVNEKGGVTYL